ncbi:MAG: LEA type 2 family protein [Stenotrophomonas sp.]
MRACLPLLALSALLLAACSSGPVKRVSPPQASISQLTVLADGQWQLELRLQNFSTMAMRFDSVKLELRSEQELLARVEAQPGFSVGAESGDLHRLTVQPTAQGRLLAAATLADTRALPYQLSGTLQASPDSGRPRDYPITYRSTLHPAPGLPGVLR